MKDKVGQDIVVGSKVAYGARKGSCHAETKTGVVVTAIHGDQRLHVGGNIVILNDASKREAVRYADEVVRYG